MPFLLKRTDSRLRVKRVTLIPKEKLQTGIPPLNTIYLWIRDTLSSKMLGTQEQ